MRPPPPHKKAGQATGRRRLNGSVRDIPAQAEHLGTTEGKIRSAVARGLLPHRRWGGRIVFLASEVDAFLAALPGITAAEALENVRARRGEAE